MRNFYLLPLLMTSLLISCNPKDSNSSIFSKEMTSKENELLLIEWNNLLKSKESHYFVYVFSYTCGHCNKLEPYMNSFRIRNFSSVYYLDFNEEIIPIRSDYKSTIGISDISSLFICGTPTLFEIQNKVVINCLCGYNEIYTYITKN